MMAEEAFNARELVATPDDDGGGGGTNAGPSSTSPPPQPQQLTPLTIKDLPKEMLVSIFMAVGDLFWVRHTIPCVCKAWNELYLSKDASPLHETLEIDFEKEVQRAMAARQGGPDHDLDLFAYMMKHGRGPHRPVVHGSRVIAWAERRAGSVRKLRIRWEAIEDLSRRVFNQRPRDDFSAEDLGRLVAVVVPSLTEISMGKNLPHLYEEPFWESLRNSVVPAGRLRSFVLEEKLADFEPAVATLGQLAGSLEELELGAVDKSTDVGSGPQPLGLSRFPESFCALTKLRRLVLVGHKLITALPAEISSLKKLEILELTYGRLSSLPRELGELSGLTKLRLARDPSLGRTLSEDETFPAALGKLKSLRYLQVYDCGLRAVPAFVGELESLEVLDLCHNRALQIAAPLDHVVESCPHLRWVSLTKSTNTNDVPWTPESRARLEAFKAKLLAKNPNAKVYIG